MLHAAAVLDVRPDATEPAQPSEGSRSRINDLDYGRLSSALGTGVSHLVPQDFDHLAVRSEIISIKLSAATEEFAAPGPFADKPSVADLASQRTVRMCCESQPVCAQLLVPDDRHELLSGGDASPAPRMSHPPTMRFTLAHGNRSVSPECARPSGGDGGDRDLHDFPFEQR